MKRSELRNLIKKLGGPAVVARYLSEKTGKPLTGQAISQWHRVPKTHCINMELLAREKRVVRSDGEPYVCEVFQPDINWGDLRGTRASFQSVEA